jgi:hypothetical protein
VVLRLDATGSETILWTDSAGTYGAESLAAGRYTITIAHPGFKTFVFVDVELQPGLRAAPRAVLELANLREALIRTPPPNPRDYPAWVGPTTRSIRQIEDLARPGRPGSRRPVELPIFVIR